MMQQAALMKPMPAWLHREEACVKETGTHLQVTFRCKCRASKQQVSVRLKKGESPDAAAIRLAELVNGRHGACALPTPPLDEMSLLEVAAESVKRLANISSDCKDLKRRKVHLAATNELLHAKVQQGEAAVKVLTEVKRLKSMGAKRRMEWDPVDASCFDKHSKCKAMNATEHGLEDTLKYWCQGSKAKLLQLILAVIQRHDLKEQVLLELCGTSDATNTYIVQQARSALAELKACKSEQQRQQYRLILSALAPLRSSGQVKAVAVALGVSRKKKPFQDAMDTRAQFDAAVTANLELLQVGDHVLCRHGQGVVVEIEDGYEDESADGPGKPCAVKITAGGIDHISRFPRSRQGKGAARLQHVPGL